MNKFTLNKALIKITKEIEKKLDVELVGIERVSKIYGSNANSFMLISVDKDKRVVKYFLKFIRGVNLLDEINGTNKLINFLSTPKVILTSNDYFWNNKWILFEHIGGTLLAEKFLSLDKLDSSLNKIVAIEKDKEELLKNMYLKTKSTISSKDYLKLNTNSLFYKQIIGKRFNEFYTFDSGCISNYFNYKIILNGHEFKYDICSVLNKIKDNFLNVSSKNNYVDAYLGQGDGHHGNIIVTNNGKIWFIDNEYSGNLPAFMELSKPYYNDFLGELFFHHNDILNKYFTVNDVNENNKTLSLNITSKEIMNSRLKITNEKIKSRIDLLTNKESIDFLTLNDYLIMCHCLTKNPNFYNQNSKYLFLVFTLILADFDPLKPESIYTYF